MVRRVGGGVVAALVVGAVVGAVARLFMRVVTEAADAPSGFSWGGTLFILMIYAVVMVPGAVLAALVRHPARWALPAAGAVFLCFPAVGVASEEIGSTAGFSTAQWVGVGTAGLAVFATIALLPLLTVRLVDRLVPHSQASGTGISGMPPVR